MACQTRLSLPPAADLDSLIQSFASNNSDPDDGVPVIANNSSLNVSQIRRKLFLEEDDLFDDLPPVQVRRSSSFDVIFIFIFLHQLHFVYSWYKVDQVYVKNQNNN